MRNRARVVCWVAGGAAGALLVALAWDLSRAPPEPARARPEPAVQEAASGDGDRRVVGGRAPVLPAPTVASAALGDEGAVALADDGVTALGDDHYEVARDLVDALLAEPTRARGVRVVPSDRGVHVRALRSDSLFARAGLRNGDLLVEANGVELTTPDGLLEGISRLASASDVELDVMRRGERVRLRYTVR